MAVHGKKGHLTREHPPGFVNHIWLPYNYIYLGITPNTWVTCRVIVSDYVFSDDYHFKNPNSSVYSLRLLYDELYFVREFTEKEKLKISEFIILKGKFIV